MPHSPARAHRSIAVVTCYRHQDYVRAVSLRDALVAGDAFDEVLVVKNRSRGIRRYLDVTLQLWKLRKNRPDVYLVTFRGYEILPLTLALAGGRPVVFDEFINPIEWFVHEHRKFSERSLAARALTVLFRRWSLKSQVVLTDTEAHAGLSSRLMGIDRAHYRAIPVGTDERTFAPRARHGKTFGVFTVLYYGSMLPLHGLEYVLEAAVSLSPRADIAFRLVGGDETTVVHVADARARGARIEHELWIDYAKLPELFDECELFLAGPFGATVQSQYVITGKTYQFLNSALPTVVGANEETVAAFTDKKDALIVEQGSSAALRSAILWASEHRGELTDIGLAGRELYLRCYSNAVLADALADVPWGIA